MITNTYTGQITQLADNEVFVFHSNYQGFHGAGAAGYASFNKHGNIWRWENYAARPFGWKGKWNTKGMVEGFQQGTIGKSYSIPTVKNPGQKRSIPLEEIKESINRFYQFAKEHSEYKFYVAQGVGVNLNGYSPNEMAYVYNGNIPNNVYFNKDFAKLINQIKLIYE